MINGSRREYKCLILCHDRRRVNRVLIRSAAAGTQNRKHWRGENLTLGENNYRKIVKSRWLGFVQGWLNMRKFGGIVREVDAPALSCGWVNIYDGLWNGWWERSVGMRVIRVEKKFFIRKLPKLWTYHRTLHPAHIFEKLKHRDGRYRCGIERGKLSPDSLDACESILLKYHHAFAALA